LIDDQFQITLFNCSNKRILLLLGSWLENVRGMKLSIKAESIKLHQQIANKISSAYNFQAFFFLITMFYTNPMLIIPYASAA
jgi:hypothetical protein